MQQSNNAKVERKGSCCGLVSFNYDTSVILRALVGLECPEAWMRGTLWRTWKEIEKPWDIRSDFSGVRTDSVQLSTKLQSCADIYIWVESLVTRVIVYWDVHYEHQVWTAESKAWTKPWILAKSLSRCHCTVGRQDLCKRSTTQLSSTISSKSIIEAAMLVGRARRVASNMSEQHPMLSLHEDTNSNFPLAR